MITIDTYLQGVSILSKIEKSLMEQGYEFILVGQDEDDQIDFLNKLGVICSDSCVIETKSDIPSMQFVLTEQQYSLFSESFDVN